jgi:hypothetical protein
MNWRFGYSLGASELDSQLLGLASVAADGMKALIPFFLFAALRNKQWSQAAAAAVLWCICISYSLTSALGFSALNRAETAGERTVQATVYSDLRAELDKTRERLAWVPQHRPAGTVAGEMEAMKLQKMWRTSNGCVSAPGPQSRAFCADFQRLGAEHASALEAERLQTRIDDIRGKLAEETTAAALASSDPQVAVLSSLSGQNKELVQTALTLLVAALVELGSSLGLFVAFSSWRLAGEKTPAAPAPQVQAAARPAIQQPSISANDNRSAPRLSAPETDVERFHKERVANDEGESLTATELYEDYCNWCEENHKEPMALPTFGRQFGELGVHKAKISGRIRYIGIKLSQSNDFEEDRTPERVAPIAVAA